MAHAPENSMSAFKKAIELGADMIELDVHSTKDGKAIIMHDDAVDRMTNGTGIVNKLTLKEIKKLRINQIHERVPTLEEAIKLIKGKARINIEIKEPRVLKEVLRLVKEYGIEDYVVVSSFIFDIVMKCKKLNPRIKTATLYVVGPNRGSVRPLAKHGLYALHVHYLSITRRFLRKAREAGIRVAAWGADDRKSFDSMIKMGVDAIITNDPGLARK